MSGNIESDRTVTTSKMYPIDLAPQKITIVKSVSNNEVKMAHLIPGQSKSSGANQIIGHGNSTSTLMRPGLAQIISPSVVSQLITPSGQIISPATQIISQGTQLSAPVSSSSNSMQTNIQTNVPSSVSGTQMLNVGGQLVTGGNMVVNTSVRTLPQTVRLLPPLPHPNTRPAVQLSGVNVNNTGGVLVTKPTGPTSHVPRGLAAGASLAVRPVAPPISQSATQVNNNSWCGNRTARGALVYTARGPTVSHPSSTSPAPSPSHSTLLTIPTTSVLNSSSAGGRVRAAPPAPPAPRPLPLLQRNYQPAKVVGVASVGVRGVVGNSAPTQLYYEVPRPPAGSGNAPSAHPAHSLPHSLAPPGSLGHGSSGAPLGHSGPPLGHAGTPIGHTGTTIGPVGSTLGHSGTTIGHAGPPLGHAGTTLGHAGTNLGHPGPTTLGHTGVNTVGLGHSTIAPNVQHSTTTSSLAHALTHVHRPHTPFGTHTHSQSQVSLVSGCESRSAAVPPVTPTPRPSILRKRDVDSSPTKPLTIVQTTYSSSTGWEDVPAGGGGSGSTTISASSSPHPDDEPEPEPEPMPVETDISPRKKPRKQILTNDVRQYDYQPEEPPPSPPPVTIKTPKRPQLGAGYVCGWRSTALHFARPADVRRRDPVPADILAIAARKHVLAAAAGWKLHHLTAQMDDLVSLESDVGEQLTVLLRAVESAPTRALAALQPTTEHTLLELLKGNIQRSKIVCEGIQEAREDILRVFTHRKFVSEILSRQADKRCFRKHRSQS